MLLGDMEIGVRDFGGEQQPVMFQAASFPQLPEPFGTKHFSQGVGRIHRAIDNDMSDMYALGCKLRIQRLAKQTPPAHRCRMRMLPAVTAHGRGSRGNQDRSLATFFHVRAQRRGQAK